MTDDEKKAALDAAAAIAAAAFGYHRTQEQDEDRPEYSVYQFFPDGSCERVLSLVKAEEAVEQAKRLTMTLGAKLGTTRRVVITDGGDCTVFEWTHGVGITHQ